MIGSVLLTCCANRDHQQEGGPRKEKDKAAAVGHQLLFLVEPGRVNREET